MNSLSKKNDRNSRVTENKDRASRLKREIEADELALETIELADFCEPGLEEETAAKIREIQKQAGKLAPWKYGDSAGEP